jgi:hypothetical protein
MHPLSFWAWLMKWYSLSLLINFGLTLALLEIRIVILACFSLLLAWNIFFPSFHFQSAFDSGIEVCFLQVAKSQMYFFNTINQSLSFKWRIKITYIELLLKIMYLFLAFCFLNIWFFLNSHLLIYLSSEIYSFLYS